MEDAPTPLFVSRNEEGTEFALVALDEERCAVMRGETILRVAHIDAPGAVPAAVDLFRRLIGHDRHAYAEEESG